LFWLTVDRSGPPRSTGSPAMAERFVSYVQILDRLPDALRPELLATIRGISPSLAMDWQPASGVRALDGALHSLASSESALIGIIGRGLGPGSHVAALPAQSASASPVPEHRELRVAAVLPDGSMASATLPALRPPPGGPTPLVALLFTLALIAVLLIAFLFWAAHAITAPLARFAGAAEGFALDRDPSPLPEGMGPHAIARGVH
jgi:hypothetical protein